MRITFLGPHTKISGGVRIMLNYAHLLSKRGHQVKFLVPSRSFIRRNTIDLIKRKPNWFRNFEAKLKRVPNFDEKYIPDGDIIIATAWQTARPVASYSSIKGKKFYLVQHYESLYHGDPKLVDPTYKLPIKKIVVSNWLKDIMEKKFNSRVYVLINPIDFKLFHYLEKERKEKPIRVLTLHHPRKWKGTDKGVEAFKKVQQKYPQIKLVLFGARKKKINIKCDEYFYKPKQEDLAKIYSSCHIYLCPSEYEGLGLPPMEAMACKCALVTFDTGGSRDYAFDGKTAMVAEKNNIDELSKKLELLVQDKNLRVKIAKNGYQFIQKMPTWEEQAGKLEDIFKKALKNT